MRMVMRCLGALVWFPSAAACGPDVVAAKPEWAMNPDLMAISRNGQALPANDGTMLVTGGNLEVSGTYHFAERYNWMDRTWTAIPNLKAVEKGACSASARKDHQATVMQDGRILVTGGRYWQDVERCGCVAFSLQCGWGNSSTYVVFDPSTEEWSEEFEMSRPHVYHTVTQLETRLVIVGGPGPANASLLETAETCTSKSEGSPLECTPSDKGNEAQLYLGHSATKLNKNEMLVFGGAVAPNPAQSTGKSTANPPDPLVIGSLIVEGRALKLTLKDDGSPSPTPITTDLPPPRVGHLAVQIGDDVVLIAGGRDDKNTPLSDAWLFQKDHFVQVAPMHTARAFAAAFVWDGKVLVTGGFSKLDEGEELAGEETNLVELYDPKTNTWTQLPPMQFGRARHSLVPVEIPKQPLRKFLAVGGIGITATEDAGPGETDDKVGRNSEQLFLNGDCTDSNDCSPHAVCWTGHPEAELNNKCVER